MAELKQEKRVTEVFKEEVREFSIYDCERSIPSGVDGFKPSQRKVIFGMSKKFNNQEVKVSIASAGIMEVSCYHHGDLSGVIVNMAQDFPGTNNLPFLDPIGQFGSRIGPDASAPRYIFTKINENFKKIFRKEDEMILNYLEDDGTQIEPDYYLPIIPSVLINGAKGMGTGFATTILNYNPEDIRNACITVLEKKKKPINLIPWYKGFSGKIEKDGEQVVFTGCLEVINTTTIKITELPIGSYTKAYREVLNTLEEKGIIKSYDDDSNEQQTLFTVRCARELTATSSIEDLLKTFRLISRETENVTVWLENGRLKKFNNVNELVYWFVDFRTKKYEERRLKLLEQFQKSLDFANEKIRFIKFYISNAKWFSTSKKTEIEERLANEKFVHVDELMSIRVYNLTKEQIEKLENEIQEIEKSIEFYQSITADKMYLKELKELKF
jgi:DNA topoisomerase-2